MLEPSDVLDKMIYSLCNPVEAGLVARATEWPGATSIFAQYNDSTLVVKRPAWFFSDDGNMPETVELRFSRPRGFEHLSHPEWEALLRNEVDKRERKHAAERAARGTRVMGRNAVMNQPPGTTPRTPEPRRKLRPTVASRNKWRRVEALQRCVRFLERYRAAFEARRAGDSVVEFPFGSYKLARLGLVRVEPPPN